MKVIWRKIVCDTLLNICIKADRLQGLWYKSIPAHKSIMTIKRRAVDYISISENTDNINI